MLCRLDFSRALFQHSLKEKHFQKQHFLTRDGESCLGGAGPKGCVHAAVPTAPNTFLKSRLANCLCCRHADTGEGWDEEGEVKRVSVRIEVFLLAVSADYS